MAVAAEAEAREEWEEEAAAALREAEEAELQVRLRKEREAVAARGGIVPKTAAKVATDERTWDLYVQEQGIEVGEYPSQDQVRHNIPPQISMSRSPYWIILLLKVHRQAPP